jgi:uncharacterized alkaline shock family protein YloU
VGNHTKKTDLGVIRIEKNVLGEIATRAAESVPGVSGVGTQVMNILNKFLGERARYSGARVTLTENVLKINIPIKVKYNVDIHSVASEVQGKVHSALEEMLGITYAEINVIVRGVSEKEGGYESS